MGKNLGRYVFWGGVLGVSLPLLMILTLQYRSLVTLQETLPAVRKERMVNFLNRVTRDIEVYYRNSAQILDVPTDYFCHDEPKEYVESHTYEDMVRHFRGPNPAARRYFIATTGAHDNKSYSIVLFYNAEKGVFERDPGTRTWGAAHGAAANWLVHSLTGTKALSSAATVDERDQENRIIVKPILEDAEVIGVTGMILDQSFFLDNVLKPALRMAQGEFFSNGDQEVVVTVYDSRQNAVLGELSSRPAVESLSVPLKYVFTDWTLHLMIPEPGGVQWSQLLSTANLSLSALMSILLISGLVITLGAASKAMKLSQMKADFVSNVSHELRTPLASIRVFAEFLRLGRVTRDEQMREYGEYIEMESRRLTQLIDNILDFSRIESGRKAYNFERTDLRKLTSNILEDFRPHAEKAGFQVSLESAPQLPSLNIDPAAIAQALTNLLDNAVKYSGDSRQVTVRLSRENGHARLSVSDDGIGIAASEQERIFDKFYRVGTGLVHDVKGSGLGLSLVKHIVEAHGGRITVKSRPGAGSTFTIHLPLSPSGTTTSSQT